MAAEVSELVVAMRSDGVGEATDDLGEMEEQFNDTADSVESSGEELQDYATRFRGAMGAIIGGLAVASAGILSNVPVLNEAFGGLTAIMDALGFQLDRLIRSLGGGGLADILFQVSDAIYTAEGAAAAFWQGLTLIGTALAGLKIAAFLGVIGSVSGALATLGGIVGTVATALLGLVSAPALIIAAFAAFIFFFREDIANAIHAGIDAVQGFVEFVVGLAGEIAGVAGDVASAAVDVAMGIADEFTSLVSDALDWGQNIVTNIGNGFFNMMSGLVGAAKAVAGKVSDKIGGLVDDALDWGKDLINEFVAGVKGRVDWARDQVKGAFDNITPDIKFDLAENDRMAQRWGADLITEFTSGAERASQEENVPLPTDMNAGGGFRARRERDPVIVMDGRELTKQDGRFRDDETSRRATNG